MGEEIETYDIAFGVYADAIGVKVSECEAGKGEESDGLEEGRHVDCREVRWVNL